MPRVVDRLLVLLLCAVIHGALGCEAAAPESDAVPAPPEKSDSPLDLGYEVTGVKAWYLVGDGLTPGQDALTVKVRPVAASPHTIRLWLDGGDPTTLTKAGTSFTATVDLAALGIGEHEVLLAADSSATAFARLTFRRSYPFYVVVSNDWDDPDNPDANLARQQALHDRHSALKLTHFVGPYTFTDPSVTAARARDLAQLVTALRDDYGDEIGLHIHPYCSFVEQTSVPCRTSPSYSEPVSDATGYTVSLAAYAETEMTALLAEAVAIFEAQGLGRPTSFRAGGWTAQIHTLRALAGAGFVVDASGCNWSRLEEWEGVAGTSLYDWVRANWATIDDTTQPYYPSADDMLASIPPQLAILEVPDNGILADYVTADEMIAILRENWDGSPLTEPRTLSIGYHPPSLSQAYFARIDGALTHIDGLLAQDDRGPISYTTMSALPLVWRAP